MASVDNTLRTTQYMAKGYGHTLSRFNRKKTPWEAKCKNCGLIVTVHQQAKFNRAGQWYGYTSWAEGAYNKHCPKGTAFSYVRPASEQP